MADFVELIAQFLVVAFGALAGSTFMWLFLGPLVAKRGMNRFMSEAYDLSDEELADPKEMMKAITKKQGETFASSIYGALGNVIQSAPTDELAKIAGEHPELVDKFLGNGGGQNALSLLGQLNGGSGNGSKNPFAGIVQLMLALQAMGAMGGGGGSSGGMLGGLMGGGGGHGFSPGLGR